MKKKTILAARLTRNLWSALLLILYFNTAMASNGPGDEATKRVKEKLDYVKDNGLLVSQINPSEVMQLPVGIVRQIDGKSVIIAIDSARIKEEGGSFSVFAGVKLPNTDDDDFLAFAAKGVKFKATGGIDFSNTKLMLVSERIISISEKIKLRLPADGHNYIEWDCNGFKTINLKGEFIFDTTMIKPDLEMSPPGTTKVTATFEVTAQTGFNFLISTSITPFRIARLGDMSFSVTNATVDLSDLSNPNNFYYPTDYPSYYGGDANLWRGFYLEELQVKLPKGISTASGRAKFTAHNVVIDEMGFSGSMAISNLFDINSGSLDGWAFSVDSIGIQIMQNRLVGGSLAGTMNVPFLKDDTLSYSAEIEQRNGELDFSFMIQTNANHVYNMAWGGTLKLNAGSSVTVAKQNGRFSASANLSGALTVSQPLLSVDQLKFQNLKLSTQSPYFISGTFEFANSTASATQPRASKFPISITNLGIEIAPGTAYLKADISLNLMNSEDRGFSAKTSIKVKGKLDTTSQTTPDGELYKTHKWVYDGITFGSIALSAKIGSVELAGSLDIFDDPRPDGYGTGFRGNVSVKFPPMKAAARANVYFGSTFDTNGDDYRYWQFNVYVPTTTIPVVPPLIDLKGILGGASYHMTRMNPAPDSTFMKLSNSNISSTENANGIDNIEATPEFVFRPNKNIGLGIMLGVTLVVKNEKIINADATLGVEFNTNGGINQIWFKGAAYFFAAVGDRGGERKRYADADGAANNNPAPVVAFIDMLYDNPNNVFHASIKTYVRFGEILKGLGTHGLVGEAVVHVDPRDWYIYIGRPSQMMGLDVLELVQIRSYFMMGSRIERMPPPPPQVTDILGGNWTPPDYGGAMASGQGFGFGAHFSARFPKNGDFTMGPFYASFGVGAGADIMITKYNGMVSCGGGTPFQPGIKGWYAAGQVYAYLQGSIGIKIRRKKFSIIDIGAAAILQARLPNPTFMKGAVGGKFRILGGLIKGSVRFKFTIGKDCAPVGGGSELDNIKVIESIKPDSASTYVSVFVKPTAVFNVPLNVEMPLVEDDGSVHTYRIIQNSVTLTRMEDNQAAPGTPVPNSTNDAVIFNTSQNLTGNKMYKFRVELKWQEKINGTWTNPGGSGQPADIEVREVIFKTGPEPMSIPFENVEYSYPISRQYNFYKNQTSQCYIQLKTGQPAVFAASDQFGSWNINARFYPANGGQMVESPVTYYSWSNRVVFNVPAGLENGKIYTLVIVKSPQGTVNGMPLQDSLIAADENVYVSENTSILQDMNQGFAMDNQAEQDMLDAANTTAYDPVDTSEILYRTANLVNLAQEVAIYRINFRTSKFNTFTDKMNALNNPQDVLNVLSGNITAIGKRYSTTENFDEIELYGKGNNDVPLVQMTSAGTGNEWYNYYMYPNLYELYGTEAGIDITWRNLSDLAEPSESNAAPLKAVKAHNNLYPTGYALTDDQVLNGYAPSRDDDVMFAYYLSYYCSRDYNEMRNKAASLYLNNLGYPTNVPAVVERLLFWASGYTDLINGQYPVKANYLLPGSNYPIVTRDINLHFQNGVAGTLVVDNKFDSGIDGWQASSDGSTALVTNENGRLKLQNAAAGACDMRKTLPYLISGRQYKFSLDLDKGDCSSIKISVRDVSENELTYQTTSTNGRIEVMFTANNGAAVSFRVERNGTGSVYYIDNATLTLQ